MRTFRRASSFFSLTFARFPTWTGRLPAGAAHAGSARAGRRPNQHERRKSHGEEAAGTPFHYTLSSIFHCLLYVFFSRSSVANGQLAFYWKGKLSARATPVSSGQRQTAKTYHGTMWRIAEAHHESSAIEWTVDRKCGATQLYEVSEKQEEYAEEDPEDVAERLARGKSLIDDLRGSASKAEGGFVASPGTDESLSPKTLADRRSASGEEQQLVPMFNGLPNPSNYCFLNATLQCLRHTPYLAARITAAAPDDPSTRRGRELAGVAPLLTYAHKQSSVLLVLARPSLTDCCCYRGFAALLRRMEAGGDAIGAADAKRQVSNPHLIITSSSPNAHLILIILTSSSPRLVQGFISACSSALPPDAISGLPLVQTAARQQGNSTISSYQLQHCL